MKIAILTCDQLPNLNLQDQPLPELSQNTYYSYQWFGIIQIRIGVILIF
jgi:hypothetical protein